MVYPQEVTGHRIETYLKSLGVYDIVAFCWPTPPGQNFAKTLTTAPRPSALCLPSSAVVATPNRCTGECSHVHEKYRHCVIGPGHRVSGAVLRPCLQPHGFIILRGYVPSAMATAAHTDTCRYVDWVIDQFDEPHGGSSQRDAWSRLNTIPGHWWQDNKHTSWKNVGGISRGLATRETLEEARSCSWLISHIHLALAVCKNIFAIS